MIAAPSTILRETPRERMLAHIGLIALRHGTTRGAILGRTDTTKTRAARREVVAYLDREGKSCVEIGRILNRHHTTILYLLGRAKNDRKANRTRNNAGIKTANDNAHSRAGARNRA